MPGCGIPGRRTILVFPGNPPDGVLAPRLLLERVQRPVGRVGVHPSAPMEQNTYRKSFKMIQLRVYHIGAI